MSRNVSINVGATNAASGVLHTLQKDVRKLRSEFSGLSKVAGDSLKNIGSSLSGFGRNLSVAGGAVAGGFVAAAKVFASTGDDLDKMSKRTGISVEGLSELAFAAEQSGAGIGTIESGIKGMQRSLFDASRGSKEVVDALGEVGLSAESLKGQLPEDQFTVLVDRIGKIGDPSNRAAIAMKLFGRAGQQLLPMMQEGKKGIAILRKEAGELGRQMTSTDAKAAAELTDSWNRMRSVGVSAALQIGASMAPMLNRVVSNITDVTKGVVNFIRDNRQFVGAIGVGAVAVTGLGLTLLGIGGAVALAGSAISGLGVIVGTAGSVIAAVFSPVGLIVAGVSAAVIGVGAAFAYAAYESGLLSDVMVSAKQILKDVWAVAKTTFEGISNALRAGNWQLAAKIGWAGVKVAFWEGLQNIGIALATTMPKLWVTVRAFFTKWVSVALNAAKVVAESITNPLSAVENAASFLKTGLNFEMPKNGIGQFMVDQARQAKAELATLNQIAKDQAAQIAVVTKDSVPSSVPGPTIDGESFIANRQSYREIVSNRADPRGDPSHYGRNTKSRIAARSF